MMLKHTANHPEVVGLLWLSSDLHFAFQCRGRGSIPGQGTKNPQAVQCGQNKKKNLNKGIKMSDRNSVLGGV